LVLAISRCGVADALDAIIIIIAIEIIFIIGAPDLSRDTSTADLTGIVRTQVAVLRAGDLLVKAGTISALVVGALVLVIAAYLLIDATNVQHTFACKAGVVNGAVHGGRHTAAGHALASDAVVALSTVDLIIDALAILAVIDGARVLIVADKLAEHARTVVTLSSLAVVARVTLDRLSSAISVGVAVRA